MCRYILYTLDLKIGKIKNGCVRFVIGCFELKNFNRRPQQCCANKSKVGQRDVTPHSLTGHWGASSRKTELQLDIVSVIDEQFLQIPNRSNVILNNEMIVKAIEATDAATFWYVCVVFFLFCPHLLSMLMFNT